MQLLQISGTSLAVRPQCTSNGDHFNWSNIFSAMSFSCAWFSLELGLIFDFANARSSAYGDVIIPLSTPFAQTSHQAKLIKLISALVSLPWCKVLTDSSFLQFTQNFIGSKVFTPCSSMKPLEAWNAVSNVPFASFFSITRYPITRWEM